MNDEKAPDCPTCGVELMKLDMGETVPRTERPDTYQCRNEKCPDHGRPWRRDPATGALQ